MNIFISATTTECFDCTTSSKCPFKRVWRVKITETFNFHSFKTDQTNKQTQLQKLLIFRDSNSFQSNQFNLTSVGDVSVREDLKKKNVFFRALPESPKPPPPMTRIRATWSSFFGSRNSRFENQFRT